MAAVNPGTGQPWCAGTPPGPRVDGCGARLGRKTGNREKSHPPRGACAEGLTGPAQNLPSRPSLPSCRRRGCSKETQRGGHEGSHRRAEGPFHGCSWVPRGESLLHLQPTRGRIPSGPTTPSCDRGLEPIPAEEKGGIRPQDWSVAVASLPTDTEGLGRPGRRGGVLVVVGRARWAELAWEPQDRAHRRLQGKGLQGSSA